MIQAECPNCGWSNQVPDSARGKKGKCPKCGQVFEVGASNPPELTETSSRTQAEEKICPYCGETIKAGALICRFCRMDLQTGRPMDSPPAHPAAEQQQRHRAGPERMLWTGSPSYWNYVGAFGVGVILLVAGGLGIIVIIWALLDRNNTKYTVSSQRVTCKRGIIGKSYSEVDCTDIRNVTVNYGIIDRLLGIGKVGIATAGHAGVEVTFKGVPAPDKVAAIVRKAKAAAGQGGTM